MNIMNNPIEDVRQTGSGIIQGASHTCHVLNHKVRNKIIIKAVCDLRKISKDFDSIACCGVSGLVVAPQVCEIIEKNLIIVRKKNEERYSEFSVEGVTPGRYIILDDLVCSNNTVNHIIKTIKEESRRSMCIGAYFYLPEECAYSHDIDGNKIFQRDLGINLLNI
jgi:hypothetical protein